MPRRLVAAFLAGALATLVSDPALAAAELPGAAMSWPWALPFLGVLLSIALGPLFAPHLWHRHYGKIAALWALVTIASLAVAFGPAAALDQTIHAVLAEYLSFIVLLFALYTVAGGILVTGNARGTPLTNTVTLALGTLLASLIGTTGASMVLIRPLIRANDERLHNVHVVIFFIFLVSNVGGALTPLGDPPLFVGFLRGVDFFWTARHLFVPTTLLAWTLLLVFFALDSWFYHRESRAVLSADPTPPRTFRIRGMANLLLIAAIVGLILISASWKPGIALRVRGTVLPLEGLLRDAGLLAVALLSLWMTPNEHRAENDFNWEPIREVAKLFAAIFVCIVPVLAMLRAGAEGLFGPLIRAVTGPNGAPKDLAYFWLTGTLSAFLDNAPTYLVFFELAGGNAQDLMGRLAPTLAAISMGAVYMGAMTYIGNAPNFMVSAIALDRGVKMPGFFGYMGWSAAFLMPPLVVVSSVWFLRS